MEPNISVTTEENKDAKLPTENETVMAASALNSEEGVKEEAKETEPTSETPTTQKRTLDGEEEDEDSKKKRRKG
jgi:hypothetical protein